MSDDWPLDLEELSLGEEDYWLAREYERRMTFMHYRCQDFQRPRSFPRPKSPTREWGGCTPTVWPVSGNLGGYDYEQELRAARQRAIEDSLEW